MKTEIPNETRYTHDFPSHYRKVIHELERENAALRSLLREAVTDFELLAGTCDGVESEDFIERVKAALGEAKP